MTLRVPGEAKMDMEIDPGSAHSESALSSASSAPSKRLAIKHTTQTNFGDDYVFQIASSQEILSLAVSLSSNTIKLYSPGTGQCIGDCGGHSRTINEISFSVPSSAHTLFSCSSDGTIRAWDTRSLKQVSSLRAAPNQEVYSFGIGGSSGNLLAAGCNEQILFWDLRSGKLLSTLEESHMDDVTQVRFVPGQSNKLISASVDGLLCLFDTSGQIDDEDHLDLVMNVGTSISKIGFFNQNQKLWCLTHIETLRFLPSNPEENSSSKEKCSFSSPSHLHKILILCSTWDWRNAKQEVILEKARSLASESWNLVNVDYFVDCISGSNDGLWLIGGTNEGALGYFPVHLGGPGVIGPAEAILEGGHSGVVRTILPSSGIHGSLARNNGIFGWTGGEDGRLCCWQADNTLGAERSWISNSLVEKSQKKFLKNNRHHPY